MSINDFIRSADLIFVGTVAAVAPAPGIGSGTYTVLQRVTYQIQGVIKGNAPSTTVEVFHPVVEGTATAGQTPSAPGLSTNFFAVGDRFIVVANEAPDPDNPGRRRLVTKDPDNGVIKVDAGFNLPGRPLPPPTSRLPSTSPFLVGAVALGVLSLVLGVLRATAASLGSGLAGIISAVLHGSASSR